MALMDLGYSSKSLIELGTLSKAVIKLGAPFKTPFESQGLL